MARPPLSRQFFFRSSFLLGVAAVLFISLSGALAAEEPALARQALFANYSAIRAKAESKFGIPLYLQSKEESRHQSAELYGILDYPFATVRDALREPAAWCAITPLDLNVKACTYRMSDDQQHVTLYAGRKFYQPPDNAYPLEFSFRVTAERPDYLAVTLHARKGPYFTKDYEMSLEAAPFDPAGTLLRFGYSYRFGLWARLAMKTYFSTVGSDKKGFTVVASDKEGKPVYVQGIRGAVERNAVRYYFALMAYMDTLAYPEEERFEKRLERWYDLTARYPQLYEEGRDEYLADKRHEHENQLKLQKEISP